jgi:DNA-binding winged helix-turn-helix (wHTH) protein
VPLRLPFGEFVLDSESRQLLREGEEVHLTPKAFELLELLVGSRPKALTKLQIRQRLWSDAFVSDASLTVLVAELRGALGDDAKEPRYVRTVYGFGYAFAGTVGSAGSPPVARMKVAPRVLWGRRATPLVEGENILGRDETAGVRIDAPGVSRRHARIDVSGDGAMLEDLGSKNGTFLGEHEVPVKAPVPLPDGSTFRLGRVLLVFRRSPDGGSTVSERSPG